MARHPWAGPTGTMAGAMAGAMAAAVVLTGCTGCTGGQPAVSAAVVTYARGAPVGSPWPPAGTTSTAVWSTPGRIALVVYGSGSCPRLPTSVTAHGAHQVTITTVEHLAKGDTGCTSDLAATTVVVALPRQVDRHGPLRVVVDGTPTDLAAR